MAAVINRNDTSNNHNKVENETNAIPWALLLQPGSGRVISYLPGEIFSRKCKSVKNRTAQVPLRNLSVCTDSPHNIQINKR